MGSDGTDSIGTEGESFWISAIDLIEFFFAKHLFEGEESLGALGRGILGDFGLEGKEVFLEELVDNLTVIVSIFGAFCGAEGFLGCGTIRADGEDGLGTALQLEGVVDGEMGLGGVIDNGPEVVAAELALEDVKGSVVIGFVGGVGSAVEVDAVAGGEEEAFEGGCTLC